ncbi:MAG: hypothetical protein HKN24_15270, partial [Acidimicrobiales bacterium]|nr:hypothetical protein [Acidimicrobiales bacterium]
MSGPLPDFESLEWYLKAATYMAPGLALAATVLAVLPGDRSGGLTATALLGACIGAWLVGAAAFFRPGNNPFQTKMLMAGAALFLIATFSPLLFSDDDPVTTTEFTSCEDQADLSRNECEALRSIYLAVGGADSALGSEAGWLQTATPCSQVEGAGWEHIECTGGRVVSLDLADLGLEGFLAPEVGDLGALEVLDVSRNMLTGPPPDSLGQLSRLLICDLSMNQWQQPGNRLREILDARCRGWNAGPFSDCESIQGLPPAECQALVAIWDGTDGEGWLPNEFVSNPGDNWLVTDTPCAGEEQGWRAIVCRNGHVEELYLGNMNLVGELPENVGALENLKVLHIYDNELGKQVPLSLASLDRIEECYLWGNEFDLPTSNDALKFLDSLCRWTAANSETGFAEGGLAPFAVIDSVASLDGLSDVAGLGRRVLVQGRADLGDALGGLWILAGTADSGVSPDEEWFPQGPLKTPGDWTLEAVLGPEVLPEGFESLPYTLAVVRADLASHETLMAHFDSGE